MSSSGLANDLQLSENEACIPPYEQKFGMSEQKYNELVSLLQDSPYDYEVQVEILRAAAVLCQTVERGIVRLDIEQGLLSVKFKNSDTRQEQESPQGKEARQSEKSAERFRAARVNDPVVSMEVKMLRPVREASKHIATAHNVTAQEFVERLLVDYLNEHPNDVQEGKKRLEQFKGSTSAAKRFAERIELERLRELQKATSLSNQDR